MCAVVSRRWACRKRRRKNSPSIREAVLVMTGMKVMLRLFAYYSRHVLILLRAATCSGASRSWGCISKLFWWGCAELKYLPCVTARSKTRLRAPTASCR